MSRLWQGKMPLSSMTIEELDKAIEYCLRWAYDLVNERQRRVNEAKKQ